MRARERNKARLARYQQYHVRLPMRLYSRPVVSRPSGLSPVAVLQEAVPPFDASN